MYCAIVSVLIFLMAERWAAKRFSKKFSELKSNAVAGDIMAQYELSLLYLNGFPEQSRLAWPAEPILRALFQPKVKNSQLAITWMRKAALNGLITAQTKLGHMHVDGTVDFWDPVTAFAWFKIAASNGDVDAKISMGVFERDMTPIKLPRQKNSTRR